MEPENNRGLDLEKELTCSICTEVLFQPLTLLDCLHTFCSSCLKEWFSWQLAALRDSPRPLLPTGPFTCPSCRAPVRDTQHSSTIATLLDMFLAANPEKRKSLEDTEEVARKYKFGDEVLPKWEHKDVSRREQRLEDADRQLLDEVRDASLRDSGVETPETTRERRRRAFPRPPREGNDTRRNSRNTEDRERRRRREDHQDGTRERADTGPLRPESGVEDWRRLRSEQRGDIEVNNRDDVVNRQIEHQSSLRSLISSSDTDSREMEEEILRQIREEGLLDGIDLENIDVHQEDQISERVAEAFRRRQEERSQSEPNRQRDVSRRRPSARATPSTSRDTSREDVVATSRRRRANSTSPRSASQPRGASRPPPSTSAVTAAHLGVQNGHEGRRRRRTSSSSRTFTALTTVPDPRVRLPMRTQSDLNQRSQSSLSIPSRTTGASPARSSTDSVIQRSSIDLSALRSREPRRSTRSQTRAHSSSDSNNLSAAEVSQLSAVPPAITYIPPGPLSDAPDAAGAIIDRSLMPRPLSPHVRLADKAAALSSGSRPVSSSSSAGSRHRSVFYPEPSITCAKCAKGHIEYQLHYNCNECLRGTYSICLSCYREGKGCLHWFGFSYSTAIAKWEKQVRSGELPPGSERPHMLDAQCYLPPKSSPGGADGRKTLTNEDPLNRLQSGAFCANCQVLANECYWKCDFCHEGDWGFCNTCVNQGNSCTHSLLPLTYQSSDPHTPSPSPPHAATILTGPGVFSVGHFKPLTFSTGCDICRYPIQPSSQRYHCFSCRSTIVPHTPLGEYDICRPCYPKLISSRRISPENGHHGWRRCPKGHRMVIVGFEDSRGGQCRKTIQDLVGGRDLQMELFDRSADPELQIWSWKLNGHSLMKFASSDVMRTTPKRWEGMMIESVFPPDGGLGMKGVALWSWWPSEGSNDELAFPKGAEIRECKDINGDWFYGCYMGARGVFPAPYVRVVEGN